MADDAFAQVEIGTLEESPASPKVDLDSFVGIAIAMPSKLTLGALENVPVCGTWVFPEAALDQFGILEDSFIWLVRDVDTHKSYTGHFRWHEDPAGDVDEPPDDGGDSEEDDADGGDITAMGWFNFDLARVWKIPELPARYSLVIVLNEFQSNQVNFEIREPGE